MPYAHIKKHIPEELDRRCKLTKEQRVEIKKIRQTTNRSYQEIAKSYGVSKRLVILICNPDKYEKVKEQFKERQADGRYKPTKEKWRNTMREHRQYKQSIKNKLI
jgi:hypothetical protein